MPTFATEADIRLRLQLNDTALAPQDFVLQCIEDAHEQILRWLEDNIDPENPPAALAYGETLLAASIVFRALAAKEAAEMRNMNIGGQSMNTEKRFASRMATAGEMECKAWQILADFLAPQKSPDTLALSESQPILGAS